MTPPKHTAHTPGSWKFVKTDCRMIYAGDGSSLMCDAEFSEFCPDEDADWKLIASAPDLLEALKAILASTPHSMCSDASAWARAEAAIHKAED